MAQRAASRPPRPQRPPAGRKAPRPAPRRRAGRRRKGARRGLVLVLVLVLVAAAFAGGVVARPALEDAFDRVRGGSAAATASAAPGFQAVYRHAAPGVLRLDAVVCGELGGRGVGTGFLALDARHVVTAAHVVDAAVAITARSTDEVRTAEVVGMDRARDLALLRLDRALPVEPAAFVAERVPEATEVLAVGYPHREPLSPTRGTVSGYDRKELIAGRVVTGLVQTSAAINPGNSGGPLLDEDGRVVGVVIAGSEFAQGLAYAVDATTVAPVLAAWHASPAPAPAADCPDPVVPSGSVGLQPPASGRTAAEVGLALGIYFDGINHGQYHLTWQQYSARKRAAVPVEVLAEQLASSRDDDQHVASVVQRADGSVVAEVDFSSTQDAGKGPRPGETCSLWTNDFVLVRESGRWVIDRVEGSHSVPCEAGAFPSGRPVADGD